METRPNNIKNVREQKNVSREFLAEKLSVTANTLQRWESGHRQPNQSKLLAIAKELGVTMADLYSDTYEEQPKMIEIPLMGRVGASDTVDAKIWFDDSVDFQEPLEMVECQPLPKHYEPERVFAFRVVGESMFHYPEGSTVFIYRTQLPIDSSAIGKTCVIKTGDGTIYLKKLVKGDSHGLFELYSTNPETPPLLNQSVAEAYKVIMMHDF